MLIDHAALRPGDLSDEMSPEGLSVEWALARIEHMFEVTEAARTGAPAPPAAVSRPRIAFDDVDRLASPRPGPGSVRDVAAAIDEAVALQATGRDLSPPDVPPEIDDLEPPPF
jgi:hypothetical protein